MILSPYTQSQQTESDSDKPFVASFAHCLPAMIEYFPELSRRSSIAEEDVCLDSLACRLGRFSEVV